MIKLLIIGLLLIYYWYFYFTITLVPPPPTVSTKSPPPPPPQLIFNTPNYFKFTINNNVWEHTFPTNEPYVISNDRIIDQNACKLIPDGYSVMATGKTLYDYLRENPLSEEDNIQFKEGSSLLHAGDKFYFKCQNGLIDNLHICPTGTLYSNKIRECVPIGDCVGQPDNTVMRHKGSVKQYILCQNEETVEKMCPPSQFFMQNRCYHNSHARNYCKTNTEPFLVNEVTKLICRNHKPVLILCPPNTKYFDKDGGCESLDCVGKPDKFKIPLPEKKDGLFRYVPGYRECMNGRLSQSLKKCHNIWDSSPHLLTNLPMVFFQGTCQPPVFCKNVFSDDPDVIVPLSNFTKVLPSWSHSKTYDSLRGVTCSEKRELEIKDMPPGYRVKKFKKELACEGDEVYPVQGHRGRYYDCQTKQVINCSPGEHFNGSRCVPDKPFSFQHEGIDIFKFDNLNEKDNWISTWNYSHEKSVKPCPSTEPVYLSIYNKCSASECVKYPFLTQLENFSISEQDFKCTFSGTSIKKEPIDYTFTFWNQRRTNDDQTEDKCTTPGQLISTGNFVWDRTVYATCNLNQPFVFCPSSSTQGIELLDRRRYGCKPPDPPYTVTHTLTTTKALTILANEIKSIIPLHPNTEINMDETGYIELVHELMIPSRKKIMLTGRVNGVDGDVQLVYRYRQSYPPDVYYKEGIGRSSEEYRAFIIKANRHTMLPTNIPHHKPLIYIEDYN